MQVLWYVTLCRLMSGSQHLKNCSAFKTLVTACPTTQHNMPEDLHLQQHHSENLKSRNNKMLIMSQQDGRGI